MKALCILLSLLMVTGGVPLLAATTEHPVKLILKDGSVVKGDLLGSDDSSVSLQMANGKSKDFPLTSIKKAFDANTGKLLVLGGQATDESAAPASASAMAAANADDEDSAPAQKHAKPKAHRKNGRKVAGDVTAAVGGVVTLVGLCAMLYGRSQMDDATSSYCSTGLCTDGYHPYTLPGEPGYYTLAQYDEYYYGQGWLYGGLTVGFIGLAACITGVIIASTGRQVDQDALLHYEDGQLALGIPPISLDPRLQGGPHATLGVVRF